MGAPSSRAAAPLRCPWCGASTGIVRVHGHGQCRTCGINTEPCCSGDVSAELGDLKDPLEGAGLGPSLFPRLFESLGGAGALVTTDAVCFALQQRMGCDLEVARDVLRAAERVGWLQTPTPGVHRLGSCTRPEVD